MVIIKNNVKTFKCIFPLTINLRLAFLDRWLCVARFTVFPAVCALEAFKKIRVKTSGVTNF